MNYTKFIVYRDLAIKMRFGDGAYLVATQPDYLDTQWMVNIIITIKDVPGYK